MTDIKNPDREIDLITVIENDESITEDPMFEISSLQTVMTVIFTIHIFNTIKGGI